MKSPYLWWTYVNNLCASHKDLPDGWERDGIDAAIDDTLSLPDGEWRMRIVRAYLFRQTHTLHGAGLAHGASYSAAKRVVQEFRFLAARHLALIA